MAMGGARRTRAGFALPPLSCGRRSTYGTLQLRDEAVGSRERALQLEP